MKISKKLGLVLSLTALCLTLFTVFSHNKTFALSSPPASPAPYPVAGNPLAKSQYTLSADGKTIDTTFDTATDNANGGGTVYDLTFTNSTAAPTVYRTANYFCASNTKVAAPATITLAGPPSGKTITGTLSAWFLDNTTTAGCSDASAGVSITNNDTGAGGNPQPPSTITYTGVKYVSLGQNLYGKTTDKTTCYGGSVLLTSQDGTVGIVFSGLVGKTSTTAYKPLVLDNSYNIPNGAQDLVNGNCYFANSQVADTTGTTVNIAGGTAVAGSITPDPSGTPTAQTTCEANSQGFSLAWAVCPLLDAASGLTNTLLDLFEDQLSFTVGQLGSLGAPNCGPSSTSTDCGAVKVHNAWSLMRDLSSGLLVLVMLLMVISQAIGGGLFDAYTVRKMLPKLAAAAILIQLSWVLTAWVIDLVNAVGQGIADLMYYPFGGSGNMGLFNLLANAKLGGVTLGVLDWAAIAVAAVLVYAFLFTILGVAFVAIVSLLFALLTLVFRKILIITLLIFAPLAIVAWILPGTERYWKMWRDNLMKALFMFPIVVAIIAAGRIFAYITATQNNGQFLNLIFILVGFFGPLFILPKTFKWGGQAMQMAGNGIMKASSKVSENPKKYFDKRQEEFKTQKGISAARRTRNWNNLSPQQKFGSIIRGDKFRSGEWDPAYRLPIGRTELKRQRQEKFARFRGQAVRSENEEREFAKEAMLEEATLQSPGNESAYFKNIIDNPSKNTHVDVEAAFDLLSEKGGDADADYIGEKLEEMFNSPDRQVQAMGAQIAQRKADRLFPKLPFNPYYKGPAVWGASAKAAEFATVSEAGLKRTVDQLQAAVRAGGAGAADAQIALDNLYNEFSRAVTSPSTSPNIGPGMRRNIEASLADPSAAPMAAQVRSALNASTAAAAVAATGGGVVGGAGGGTVTGPATVVRPSAVPPILGASPGEIRVVHEQNIIRDLPDATAIVAPVAGAAANQAREDFKTQLQNDPNMMQALAHGIAYDVPNIDEHIKVLAEVRNQAAITVNRANNIINNPSSTPEQIRQATAQRDLAQNSWNAMADRIQVSYHQRVEDASTAAAAAGSDAAAARNAEQAVLDPRINNLEAGAPAPAPGTPGTFDLRKL